MDSFRAQPTRRFWDTRIPAFLLLLGVMAGVTGARAQSRGDQAGDELAFEVVSIKPVARRVPLAVGNVCIFRTGVRYRCPASTVQQLISRAFRLGDVAWPQSQIVGGSDWIATSQFEIEALLNSAVQEDEREDLARRLPPLMRQLLEERFELETHAERRPLPVYALVRAFDDGRLGPQLREAATDCPDAPSDVTSRLPVTAAPAGRPCFRGVFNVGSIRSGALTMRSLAETFMNLGVTDRIVLDRTDLIGYFEVDLRWSANPLSAAAAPGGANSDQVDLPSLFAAVQEQLGLKLEPRTEVMDVLVIDHVEQPSPN